MVSWPELTTTWMVMGPSSAVTSVPASGSWEMISPSSYSSLAWRDCSTTLKCSNTSPSWSTSLMFCPQEVGHPESVLLAEHVAEEGDPQEDPHGGQEDHHHHGDHPVAAGLRLLLIALLRGAAARRRRGRAGAGGGDAAGGSGNWNCPWTGWARRAPAGCRGSWPGHSGSPPWGFLRNSSRSRSMASAFIYRWSIREGHGLHGDLLQPQGDVRDDLPGGDGLGVDVLDSHRHGGIPVKGQAAGEHLIEDHAGGSRCPPGRRCGCPGPVPGRYSGQTPGPPG